MKSSWREWAGLLARLLLGVPLLYGGLTKITNLEANVQQVGLYQLHLGDTLTRLVGYAQPPLEIVVGLLLMVGLFTRVSAALGSLAMLVFIFGISWAWAHGLRLDCGCFGNGGVLDANQKPTYLLDIIRDIAFLAGGVWLLVRPRTPWAIDNWLLRPIAALSPTDSSPSDSPII